MRRRTSAFVLAGLFVALLLAFGVSRFASSEPDGLDRAATDHGFDSTASPHALEDAPFADYGTRGVDDDGLGTGLAGVVGVVMTFAIAGGAVWGAARLRRSRSQRTEPEPEPEQSRPVSSR